MVDTSSAAEEAAKHKDPKSLEVKIIYNGIEKELHVAEDELVSSVLAEAIKLFPISEAQHLLALFDRHGVEITNEAQTVKQAGIKKGDRLVLRQGAVKGG